MSCTNFIDIKTFNYMHQSVSLFYREGSSDKVYHASIESKDSGFVVNFAYGRRGNALTTGTKTSSPVDLPSAQKIFDKLVKEKTAKGYTVDSAGKPAIGSVAESNDSGIRCQLLGPIEEDRALKLIADDDYIAQEKHDGRRLLIQKKAGFLTGINKKGLTVSLHPTLESLIDAEVDFVVDGEDMGDGVVIVFDVLEVDGRDLRGVLLKDRLIALRSLVEGHGLALIESIYADNAVEKRRLYERLLAEGKEGIVFKRKDAPYTPGRPSSGGSQLKYKFYETASFIVHSINGKRSVAIRLYGENGEFVEAGNVTIPPNHEVPNTGDVVEVRYLYAYKESGSVYQPVYLGKREDVDKDECSVTQLKYKAS